MHDFNQDTARRETGAFGRWLASRPAESWMFFATGIFLGGVFF